jgi:hypothetical protein
MFQVRWAEGALDQLAMLWLQGDSMLRRAITRASAAIDQRLHTNPHNQGESRNAGERVMFESPLGVQFDIIDDDRLVRVLDVWDCRPRA